MYVEVAYLATPHPQRTIPMVKVRDAMRREVVVALFEWRMLIITACSWAAVDRFTP